MEVEHGEAESLAAARLVDERVDRLEAFLVVWVAEIDEVAIVWENLRRRVATLLAIGFEGINLYGLEIFCEPLALVFCEKGESCCADSLGVERCVLDAAAGADVCSDIFHCRYSVVMLLFKGNIKSDVAVYDGVKDAGGE